MALTYSAIATTTVGAGGSSTIDFQSIPSTYTNLVLHVSARTNRSAQLDYWNLRFNNDSGNNYSANWVKAYGANLLEASSNSGASSIFIGWLNGNTTTSNTFGSAYIYIPNYTSSDFKTTSSEGAIENNASANNDYELGIIAGLWSSTATINRITLTPAAGPTILQYSTATLYGISSTV